MNDSINHLEAYIRRLLHPYGDKPLSELCRDSCSELSRLAGVWMLRHAPGARALVIQGNDATLGPSQKHDVLAVELAGRYHLIDPSIWQFKPDASSILVGSSGSLAGLLDLAQDAYGGIWQVAEELTQVSRTDISQWKRVIEANARGADNGNEAVPHF